MRHHHQHKDIDDDLVTSARGRWFSKHAPLASTDRKDNVFVSICLSESQRSSEPTQAVIRSGTGRNFIINNRRSPRRIKRSSQTGTIRAECRWLMRTLLDEDEQRSPAVLSLSRYFSLAWSVLIWRGYSFKSPEDDEHNPVRPSDRSR